IDQMKDNIRLVAQAVGKETEAEALIERVDSAIAQGAEAISAAGLEGQPFTLADAWSEGNNVSIRAFTSGSLMGAVGEEMGLVDAWDLEGDPDYGLAITDVEGLTNLPDDLIFTYYSNAVFEDAIAALEGNPILEGLPFVQAGNVHRLADGTGTSGGPPSVDRSAPAVAGSLADWSTGSGVSLP